VLRKAIASFGRQNVGESCELAIFLASARCLSVNYTESQMMLGVRQTFVSGNILAIPSLSRVRDSSAVIKT
jgi:hypothetical protein